MAKVFICILFVFAIALVAQPSTATLAIYAGQIFAVQERFTTDEVTALAAWVSARCELISYSFGIVGSHFTCSKSIPQVSSLEAFLDVHDLNEALLQYFEDQLQGRGAYVLQIQTDNDFSIAQHRIGYKSNVDSADLCAECHPRNKATE
jgi:hypothetical protein